MEPIVHWSSTPELLPGVVDRTSVTPLEKSNFLAGINGSVNLYLVVSFPFINMVIFCLTVEQVKSVGQVKSERTQNMHTNQTFAHAGIP